MKKCSVCQNEFNKKGKTCSKECQKESYRLKALEKKINKSHLEFPNGSDYAECLICDLRSNSLQNHIVIGHKIKLDEYKKKYGPSIHSIEFLENKSESIKGEKNPAYQHGGILSPYSKKFKKYDNLSEDEKLELIKETSKKAMNSRVENNNDSTKLEYYLSRGMSEKEAVEALKDRQTTFSKDICVDKYGEEDGLKVWETRQEKWMKTLDSKTDEEKEEINRKKITFGGYSKISQKLFDSLNIKEALYATQGGEKYIKLDDSGAFVDFIIGNKIIEFYGDLWHANPELYQSNDIMNIVRRHKRYTDLKASEIWKNDDHRINKIKEMGYNVLIIWEKDYKQNQSKVIEECLIFLS